MKWQDPEKNSIYTRWKTREDTKITILIFNPQNVGVELLEKDLT